MATLEDVNRKLYTINSRLDSMAVLTTNIRKEVDYLNSRVGNIQCLIYGGLLSLEQTITGIEHSTGIEYHQEEYSHDHSSSKSIYGLSSSDMLPPPPEPFSPPQESFTPPSAPAPLPPEPALRPPAPAEKKAEEKLMTPPPPPPKKPSMKITPPLNKDVKKVPEKKKDLLDGLDDDLDLDGLDDDIDLEGLDAGIGDMDDDMDDLEKLSEGEEGELDDDDDDLNIDELGL